MPGEILSLNMDMIDELNQLASGFVQLDVDNSNNKVSTYIPMISV